MASTLSTRYEHGVGQGGGHAVMKWSGRNALSLEKPVSGDEKEQTGYQTYYYGDYYSFALRGAYDKSKGESYQTYEFEDKLYAMAFPWYRKWIRLV
ncbi:hypothetical protein MTO96_006831 [Rhipicephalus appendiculatus]